MACDWLYHSWLKLKFNCYFCCKCGECCCCDCDCYCCYDEYKFCDFCNHYHHQNTGKCLECNCDTIKKHKIDYCLWCKHGHIIESVGWKPVGSCSDILCKCKYFSPTLQDLEINEKKYKLEPPEPEYKFVCKMSYPEPEITPDENTKLIDKPVYKPREKRRVRKTRQKINYVPEYGYVDYGYERRYQYVGTKTEYVSEDYWTDEEV